MVSFWPWRRDASSPASFEKTLSTLSKKIATTQTQLDNARATARRMKVLWTLYLSFAYLVYAIVLFLVVGLKNLGPLEWSGMAGGPLVIYVVRTAMTAIFNFRIDTLTARLKDQQTERAKTIQKLKDATKYDSTLELLEKYGGTENKAAKKGKRGSAEDEKSEKGQGPRTPNRTNMPPPPTANIRRGDAHAQPPRSGPNTPQPGAHSPFGPPHQSTSPTNPAGLETSAEFAPNAFGPDGGGPAAHPHEQPGGARGLAPAAVVAGEPHWYDRILDLLLGEDETAAKNRIALVCGRCRLVNGQAPPGARSLADVGVWRCMACGAANGEEQVADEGRRIVEEVVLGVKKRAAAAAAEEEEEEEEETDGEGSAGDVKREDDGSGDESGAGIEGEDKTQARVRQRRAGARKKGGK